MMTSLTRPQTNRPSGVLLMTSPVANQADSSLGTISPSIMLAE